MALSHPTSTRSVVRVYRSFVQAMKGRKFRNAPHFDQSGRALPCWRMIYVHGSLAQYVTKETRRGRLEHSGILRSTRMFFLFHNRHHPIPLSIIHRTCHAPLCRLQHNTRSLSDTQMAINKIQTESVFVSPQTWLVVGAVIREEWEEMVFAPKGSFEELSFVQSGCFQAPNIATNEKQEYIDEARWQGATSDFVLRSSVDDIYFCFFPGWFSKFTHAVLLNWSTSSIESAICWLSEFNVINSATLVKLWELGHVECDGRLNAKLNFFV